MGEREAQEDHAFPEMIERIIVAAARDDAFREKLLADREAALAEMGVQLSAGEQALLASVSSEQLAGIIDSAASQSKSRRRFLIGAAVATGATAAAILGGEAWLARARKRARKVCAGATVRNIDLVLMMYADDHGRHRDPDGANREPGSDGEGM
jgi:hypothetical protein